MTLAPVAIPAQPALAVASLAVMGFADVGRIKGGQLLGDDAPLRHQASSQPPVLHRKYPEKTYKINEIGVGGGSGGIRTHGGVPPTLVFKTRALNHSATLPCQGPRTAFGPKVTFAPCIACCGRAGKGL